MGMLSCIGTVQGSIPSTKAFIDRPYNYKYSHYYKNFSNMLLWIAEVIEILKIM